MKELIIALLLIIITVSCSEDEPVSNIGCVYGFPWDDNERTDLIGCATLTEFNSMAIPDQFSKIDWLPISDCSACARHETRGQDR
jgi:PBP1b-binding outer membrane lipoprotein LpoB